MSTTTRQVLSRREIEALIANGASIFIIDQHVIQADSWIPYHPGGEKVIQHMVGRDATDEVTILHSAEARKQIERYCIGSIEDNWTNFLPPIQGGRYRKFDDNEQESDFEIDAIRSTSSSSDEFSHGDFLVHSSDPESIDSLNISVVADDGMAHLDSVTREKINLDLEKYPPLDSTTQDAIVARYRLLHALIKSEGLYQCHYTSYLIEITRYIFLFTFMLIFIHYGWYVTSGIFMGMFWHQLVFAAHDAGHMGITHDFQIDTMIGIFIADFLSGLSLGWWKRSHNVHHVVTNSPEHDPDVEYLPLFALSHRFFTNLRSTYHEITMAYTPLAKILIKYQKYTYYPIMILGRFNLYILSWTYLLSPKTAPRKGPARWHRHLEIIGQLFFWFWYGYGIIYTSIPNNWGRFTFFMISHMIVAPLHVQLTLSHFAMSTADLGPRESFPQKMLRTTMDVDCPQYLDFFHGGLQFQAIHHLYPRIPRHNLRRTQKLVQEFCVEVGIPYALYGFVDSNRQVIGRLSEVSRQAAILAKCQEAMISGRVGIREDVKRV